MIAPRAHDRAGYTLLELLAVFAVMMVLINLGAGVVMKSTRLSAATARSLDTVMQLREVEQAFLTTAREACGVADRVGAYETGAGTLVLRMPPAPEGERFAVFHFRNQEQRLMRLEVAVSGDTILPLGAKTFPLAVAKASFDVGAQPGSGAAPASVPDCALIAMNVEMLSPSGRTSSLSRVLAAPRGVLP
ncbi:MAG: hypothetical protein KA184_01285 [Candidatus Hydrogenedentes bacterium]|nr:hypothetical protein [Candidatus Hydrogenedentota bacterium]